jgi:hypothetical protein
MIFSVVDQIVHLYHHDTVEAILSRMAVLDIQPTIVIMIFMNMLFLLVMVSICVSVEQNMQCNHLAAIEAIHSMVTTGQGWDVWDDFVNVILFLQSLPLLLLFFPLLPLLDFLWPRRTSWGSAAIKFAGELRSRSELGAGIAESMAKNAREMIVEAFIWGRNCRRELVVCF